MINDNDEEVLISDTMYPRAFAHVAPSSLKLRDSMANLSEQAIVSGHRDSLPYATACTPAT